MITSLSLFFFYRIYFFGSTRYYYYFNLSLSFSLNRTAALFVAHTRSISFPLRSRSLSSTMHLELVSLPSPWHFNHPSQILTRTHTHRPYTHIHAYTLARFTVIAPARPSAHFTPSLFCLSLYTDTETFSEYSARANDHEDDPVKLLYRSSSYYF